MARGCGTCGKLLRYDNRSGYCRDHFTAGIDTAERTRRAVASRLAWCPSPYRREYHGLIYRVGLSAAEARRIILEQVARDTGTFDPLARALLASGLRP